MHEVKGCEQCGETGYWGRTGIFEFLRVNDEIQRLILDKRDANVIKEAARKSGMRTLREDGWLKVKRGVTTVAEVLRVTQEEANSLGIEPLGFTIRPGSGRMQNPKRNMTRAFRDTSADTTMGEFTYERQRRRTAG